jgi:hypothetical protein
MTGSHHPPLPAQSFTKLEAAFPTMPLDSLPEIPLFWDDTSWSQEACPSFRAFVRDDGAHIRVFIDFPDPRKRRLNEQRFTAAWFDAGGSAVDGGRPLIVTDDWPTLLETVLNEGRAHHRRVPKFCVPPRERELRALIKQMEQALRISRTTLETVVERNSRNLAAKSSIGFIRFALDAADALAAADAAAVGTPSKAD